MKKTKRLNVLLPSPHVDWLRHEAKRRGVPVASFLRILVAEALDEPPEPEPSSELIVLDLPEHLYLKLREIAEGQGVTLSALIRAIVAQRTSGDAPPRQRA